MCKSKVNDFMFPGCNNVYRITVFEIFGVELCTTLALTFRMGQWAMCDILIAILMFSLSVTICEILRVHSKMYSIPIFDLKEDGQDCELQRRRLRRRMSISMAYS